MLDPPPKVHVALPEGAHAPARSDALALHWEKAHQPESMPGVVGLREALIRVTLDEALEVSVPCFDWAFRAGALDRIGFELIVLALPRSARSIRDWVDPQSQSVLESVARVRLRARGWDCRSQVRVGDASAIDLVVEDHVALELDGKEFHESRFEVDRRKDLQITREGRHSIRVSMGMLRSLWPEIEGAIEAALAARRHGDVGNSGKAPPVPHGAKHAPRHPPLITAEPDTADGNTRPRPAFPRT